MPHRLVVGSVFVGGMLLIPVGVIAQSGSAASALPTNAEAVINAPAEPKPELKVGKVVRAVRLRGTPPVIDGALGDEAWTTADARPDSCSGIRTTA